MTNSISEQGISMETKGSHDTNPFATHVPIIGIDYDEPDTATYRGTHIRIKDAEISLCGCCPTHDYEAMLDLAEILAWAAGHGVIMGSSSVNHFIMDGN